MCVYCSQLNTSFYCGVQKSFVFFFPYFCTHSKCRHIVFFMVKREGRTKSTDHTKMCKKCLKTKGKKKWGFLIWVQVKGCNKITF